MKKYNIDGTVLVKLQDIKEILRDVRSKSKVDSFLFKGEEMQEGAQRAIEAVIRRIFIEELRKTESQEEEDAILEMTGDFIVFRKGASKYNVKYFSGWYDGEPVITDRAPRSIHFDYESKAEEIAEELKKRTGDEWSVCNMSQQAYEDNKRLLAAIFGPDEEGENEE